MAKDKKDNEKKYHYILKYVCEECRTEVELLGPCVKCGNLTFVRIYVVEETK